jgi:hypothetical protein
MVAESSQINGDNPNNVRRETTRIFRQKREYMKDNEFEAKRTKISRACIEA